MGVPSVSNILMEKHGMEAKAGRKANCPFCHHKTFTVKPDDSIGKCFHPSCGKFITPFSRGVHPGSALCRVLVEIYHDFHKELLEQEKSHGRAWRYLVDERRVHHQVVIDSMIGVVPRGYDLESKFSALISDVETPLGAKEKARGGLKDQPQKKAQQSSEDHLQSIMEAKEKLQKCIEGGSGWLCFFYTDEHHCIVAIRFRKPYSKEFRYFKPFSRAGLFGHGLFSPYGSEEYQGLNTEMIVVEGEFNQLQLQSLSLRNPKRAGGYVQACAVGGVNNTDYEALHRISSGH